MRAVCWRLSTGSCRRSSSGGGPSCCNTGDGPPAQYIRWNESRSKRGSIRAVWSIIPNGMDLTILNLKNTSLDRSKLLTFSVLYGRKEWAQLSEFLSPGRVPYSVHSGATCLFLRLGLLAWPSSCSDCDQDRAEGLLERTQGWEVMASWVGPHLPSWRRWLRQHPSLTILTGMCGSGLIPLANSEN